MFTSSLIPYFSRLCRSVSADLLNENDASADQFQLIFLTRMELFDCPSSVVWR
ncbi:hypothetical protein GJ496_006064 [Pomphorhynchus laevis]|nr:hypothetical protein GJ496_006064 [Pomphorhynchus laevis]